MKRHIGVTVIVALALVVLVFIVRASIPRAAAIEQPIAYNHNIHVEGEGLECIDCHAYSEILPSATLPDLSVCLDCHDTDPLSEDSVEEAKLIEYIESGTEVPWQRVNEVPDHVYFSHRRHVVAGDLACMDCHGDVGAMTEPVTRPFFELTMEACMDCHKQRQVSNDCLACHR